MEQDNKIAILQPFLMWKAKEYHCLSGGFPGISRFYEFTVDTEQTEAFRAVPDGAIDLLFGIGESDVHTNIGGTVLKAKSWQMEKDRRYFGVRFEPGKCCLPKTLQIQELINQDLAIDGDSFGRNLSEKLALGRSLEERAAVFMRYYIRRMKSQAEKKNTQLLEQYIRKRIYESKGMVTVRLLREETGYSEAYLRRVFEKVHGISPKLFEKFVRFQYLLNMMQEDTQSPSMEELAVSCGYYDQPHMIKEFKLFTGLTPDKYRKLMCTQNVTLR